MEKYLINEEFVNVKSRVDEYLEKNNIHQFLNIITSNPQGMVPPVQSEEAVWKNYIATTKVPHFGPIAFEHDEIVDHEKAVVNQMTKISFIGNKETVKNQILDLKRRVEFDELMINSYIYDEKAQHHSYELLKEVIDDINGQPIGEFRNTAS